MSVKKLTESIVAWRKSEKKLDLIRLTVPSIDLEVALSEQQKVVDKRLMELRYLAENIIKSEKHIKD